MADNSWESIEDVEIGDRVVTIAPETGLRSVGTVGRLFQHTKTGDFAYITTDAGTFQTTPGHRVWNLNLGKWQYASSITSASTLRQRDGTSLRVNSTWRSSAHGRVAYDLTVEQTHTFVIRIGDTGSAVVHNCGISHGPLSRKAQSEIDNLADHLSNGTRPPNTAGGQAYFNLGGELPHGSYTKWDVEPNFGGGRGPQRVIVGDNGSMYYSPDHYGSFFWGGFL